jgi:hypothetical protein
MTSRPPRILTRQRLYNCILTNQLATPGLGSILAGRKVAGIGQLLLATAGCILVCVWVFWLSYDFGQQSMNLDSPSPPPD